MNLGIGFLPKKYYANAPSTGGYNFFIKEGIQYAINIGKMYYPDYTDEQLALFTESLAPFPLYYLFEQSDRKIIKVIKQQLHDAQLPFEVFYQSKNSTYLMITITNHQELIHLIPIMIWQHNYNMSSFWSNRKDTFTIESKIWDAKRTDGIDASIEDTLCIHFNEPTTAFLFSHDFKGTDIFSNENHFSTLEDVQKLLPSFIKINIIEYG
ncbi:hypothetical protein JFL43_18360 [Viridibacillus sp. YIM B01967]|uniref:Uncharacterized protein n=1 Tax=Viridibacillus soli TaxID=2798301 RepID=A0ABS1HBF1_9BACL|nr:hypothetical protein [Viridibacillus soli]MBK3496786.1 hypothetical protein [Viridibacillus soli]